MWKYAKWSPKTKWIITGVIASLVLLSTLNRREETLQTVTTKPSEVSSAQSSTQPTEVKCDLASGYIWTNVLLYRDSECTKPFAIVAGGGKLTTGEKGVLLKFDTGELEWKKREAVTQQAYVKTNDPAIKTMLWRDIDQ